MNKVIFNASRRFFAMAVALSVFLVSLSVLRNSMKVSAAGSYEADSSWKSSGTGTSDDPYLITTAEQLYSVAGSGEESSGKYFRLENDIYLNDISSPDWSSNADNRQWDVDPSAREFSGNFDGNGHTVYGLYYNNENSSAQQAGLFPKAWGGAVIRNLTVDFASINAWSANDIFAGAVVGFAGSYGNLTIEKCYVGENVSIDAKYAGGLLGASGGTTVTVNSSAFVGRVTEEIERYGGFAGNIWSGAIYVNDSFTTAKRGAYITWGGSQGFATNSYVSGNPGYDFSGINIISADSMKGAGAKDAMSGLDWLTVWKTSVSYPEFIVYTQTDGIWNGNADSSWTETGEGTEESPYLISTPEQLYSVAISETGGKYFKLTNDIYLNKTDDENWYNSSNTRQWILSADKPFAGVFDGGGYTVYGLYYNSDTTVTDFAALFPKTWGNVTIKNITIDKAYVLVSGTEDAYGGALVGYSDNGTLSLSKCYVGEDVVIDAKYSGGMIGGIGGASATVNSSAFVGTLNDSVERYGGFAGNVWSGTINAEDSFTTAKRGAYITWGGSKGFAVNSYVSGDPGYDFSGINIVSANSMKGAGAKGAMPLLNWTDVWTATESYPDIIDKNAAVIIKGDINSDGEINILDMIRLKKYLTGKISEIIPEAADINSDSETDSEDLVCLKKYILGTISEFN